MAEAGQVQEDLGEAGQVQGVPAEAGQVQEDLGEAGQVQGVPAEAGQVQEDPGGGRSGTGGPCGGWSGEGGVSPLSSSLFSLSNSAQSSSVAVSFVFHL